MVFCAEELFEVHARDRIKKKTPCSVFSSSRRYALFKCSVGRQPPHTYAVMQERTQGIWNHCSVEIYVLYSIVFTRKTRRHFPIFFKKEGADQGRNIMHRESQEKYLVMRQTAGACRRNDMVWLWSGVLKVPYCRHIFISTPVSSGAASKCIYMF